MLRQRRGPASGLNIGTPKDIFKTLLSKEMCDIILRESNRKGKRVTDNYNKNLELKYPDACNRPEKKNLSHFQKKS